MAVMSVVLMASQSLFTLTHRGFTALEVSNLMPAATQEALNKIQRRVIENRRIFDGSPAGLAFFGRMPAVSPAPLAGSRLATISPNMSLSVSSGVFVSTNVGNSLFFAGINQSHAHTVAAGTSRIDSYIFNYYYLAENLSVRLGPGPALELREWHSRPYIDAYRFKQMPEPKRSQVGLALYADGLRYAWDPTVNSTATAFFVLSSTGGLISSSPHTIQASVDPRLKPAKMISMIVGASGAGFKYGVSRRTIGSFTHQNPVPAYVQGSDITATFPSGFEVMIVGYSSQRQVFVRLVTVAQGNFKGFLSFENILLTTARDVY